MLLKFICCDVFARMAYTYAATSENTVDLELVPMLAHIEPEVLHRQLEERIAHSLTVRPYDAILLGYGLCGNAVLGLNAPVPIIIPKMHDCCTMFCGSREKFIEIFGKCPSMRWRSGCYYERYDLLNQVNGEPFNYKTCQEYLEYVEKYGEEAAEELWIMMHPTIETDEAAYINVEGFEQLDCCQRFMRDIALEDKKLKHVQGSSELFQKLVNGPWDDDFLTVQPGQMIGALYDLRNVMKTVDCEEKSGEQS